MAMLPYLAMTAAEFRGAAALPERCGWMACHFSPYGTGLSNLPDTLPRGSLLLVNDRTPIHGHDSKRIAQQLAGCVERLHCAGVLLDFQAQGNPEEAAVVQELRACLPCPVIAPGEYAGNGPVFLPPVPVDVLLTTYLQPWQGREIWLEAALSGTRFTLTEEGCKVSSLPAWRPLPLADPQLHIHYAVTEEDGNPVFDIARTPTDLKELLEEAAGLGVTDSVGLYQELPRL